jgi:hypothetical protein
MVVRIKKIIVRILGKAGLEIRSIPTKEPSGHNKEPLFPAEASLFERELISQASKYSMTGRLWFS